MPTIAIVYICTGEYVTFWEAFYKSFEEKFIVDCPKTYFVFTDAERLYGGEDGCVRCIYQENLGWPGNTLYRFRIFLRQQEELSKYDYVFFMNANIVCVDEVDTRFLPSTEDGLFVQHPGFYDQPSHLFPYDRNRRSTAFIPYGRGRVYVCGGVNGGKSGFFLQMCRELDQRIREDERNGVMALWHDESQINKYLLEQRNYKLLSPAYCYPEGERLRFQPKLMVRDKSRVIDVKAVKKMAEPKIRESRFDRLMFRRCQIQYKLFGMFGRQRAAVQPDE